MKNTFSETERILVEAISDKYNKVIALTGKWGIGKTFLWNKVSSHLYEESENQSKPIYVSLFGVKNTNDLKIRILQGVLKIDENGLKSIVTKFSGGVIKTIINSLFNYDLEAGVLLLLPKVVKNRLIVIDDIERKNGSFEIDEILGFFDEYSEIHAVQFLTILNTDKLKDTSIWKEMHEKVIDVEIKFNPTSSECFDAAFSGASYPFLIEIKKSIEIMNLKNIRVMERILRTVKLINQYQPDSFEISQHWIPSVALITSCYYQALEENIPLDYIHSYFSHKKILSQEEEYVSEREANWDQLLERMGIYEADDFEKLICDYLYTGIFDIRRLDDLFNNYRSSILQQSIENEVKIFKQDFYWNSKVSGQNLLKVASGFSEKINGLDPIMISSVVEIVNELGDKELADNLLSLWLGSLKCRSEYKHMTEIPYFGSKTKIHPEILKNLNSIVENNSNKMTLMQAFEDIYTNDKRSQKAIEVFRRSTCDDYKSVLLDISGSQLRDFILFHIGFIQQKEDLVNDGSEIAIENFLSACKQITLHHENDRIAFIIRSNFQYYNLIDKIE
jgi:KAP family P-loop domain